MTTLHTLAPSPEHRRMDDPGSTPPASGHLDDYIMERIDFKTRQLAIQFHLNDNARDDLHQNLAVEVLEASESYDPQRGTSWRTYACRALDVAAKRLIQRRHRVRRREKGRPANPAAWRVSCRSAVHPQVPDGRDELAQMDLKLDVQTVLGGMPDHLQEVCRLLMHRSASQAAAELGIHRNSIYRRISQVRAYFEDAGLSFLNWGATNSPRCVDIEGRRRA